MRALLLVFLVAALLVLSRGSKRLVLVLDDDAGTDEEEGTIAEVQDELAKLEDGSGSVPPDDDAAASSPDWDSPEDGNEVGESDPGSWKLVMEEGSNDSYSAGVARLIGAVSDGELEGIQAAIKEFQGLADQGHAHAQSTVASLYGHGYGIDESDLKSFLFHGFAADGGNYQSKMALAYTYYRQQSFEEAARLYAELATTAVASFVTAKDGPLVEHVRLNYGPEESKDFKKFRGEDDDDFQFLEYQAHKGNSVAMHKIGLIYYYGLRGIRRDHTRALWWFGKAVEKGDAASLEFLGELYARGFGVERNYTKAYEYFKKAIREKRYSAYNGIGYLYSIGQGVDKKNITTAREFYKRAADHSDPNAFYNLGVIYLKGAGVKKSIKVASRYFIIAANSGHHPKAFYQLAKMQQRGLGMKKDLPTAVDLYKAVAERGPWGSLLRWGLESYLNGNIALSLLLYSRAAELGYEVAQSNAAWILDKFPEEAVCVGKSGFCTVEERHRRAHSLWRFASEQGNEYAALLIGDAYYYGRGTAKDLDRAAEAYMRARSQSNAQAMYNIGYMHEHGLGLPKDFHLAKRYYDLALEADRDARLPIYVALTVLWLRQQNEESVLVKAVDMLPELSKRLTTWSQSFSASAILEEGNATLITLLVCLATVLYLRSLRRRRQQDQDQDQEAEAEQHVPADHHQD